MGLFDWLKSVLGMNGSRPDQRDSERVGGSASDRADTSPRSSNAASTETTATASTESMTDEADEEVGAAEPAEAAGPTGGDTGEPLTIIKGIGPAYADRLEAAGIGSIADLAAADPGEIGAEIDVSPKRVGRWIERAKHRV